MAAARRALVASCLLLAACAQPARPRPVWPDAPFELRDESDRDAAIDQLWQLPDGAARDRLRGQIAAATALRIDDAVADDRPLEAAILLDQLTWLWHAEPAAIGRGLASHAPLVRRLRAMFARAGALEPAVQTLIVLSELEPERRAVHLGELDEILAFADDLAVAEHGADAVRGQPIALLQPTALALPLRWLVDRYVALLVERHAVVGQLLAQQGASMPLIRAHHDVLSTARRIANVLARAGRAPEIHARIAAIQGVGYDRDLLARAGAVAEQPTAATYVELAGALRSDDHAADPAAALAVALAGLTVFPDEPGLLASAGGDARALGRVDQPIALYERALRDAREIDGALALRLGKLYGERIVRLAGGGRPAAARTAWRDVIRFTAGAAKQHPSVVWQQAAAIAESALGKGLASQGLVDAGRSALAASLERAPSIDAYETLSTIDVQVDRFRDSQRWVAHGLALLGEASSGDRYRRAKLERIAGDAHRRAGNRRAATAHYLEALRTWGSLGEDRELPRPVVAERWLERGRALWWLGDDQAVASVLEAVDADPEALAVPAGAIAFLIEAGRYRDALDAYHRCLGEPGGSELYKVYTSLWILGEARRLGEPRDQLAVDYLAGRRGDLWYEQLARAATGSLGFDALRAAATTGPRRGELAFYGAVLGLDPRAATADGRRRLLQQALDERVIFDAEYDLARRYLSVP